MKTNRFSYKSGELVISGEILESVEQVILNVKLPFKKNGVSVIKTEILNGLYFKGWCEEVQIDKASKISITSIYEKIGLCLQTGNISRIYADLLKLQTLFANDVISAGIIILPNSESAKLLGSNMANSERLIRELPIYKSAISVPLVIISFGK